MEPKLRRTWKLLWSQSALSCWHCQWRLPNRRYRACFALVIAVGDNFRPSAQLAGYAEAAFKRLGYQREYTEFTTRTRLESVLYGKLTPIERDSLLATGATLSPEGAVGLAVHSLSK